VIESVEGGGGLDFSGDSSSGVLPDSETIGEKPGGGSACSESGRLFDLPLSRVAGLCTLKCIALHVCFSMARCFVRVAFPFNPFAINIATHVVGGIFSGLFAPEWCEKSRTIKSLVEQCGGAILTYGVTLVLLRCLCLYNAFLGPFSLVLSRASFSYLFCLGLTQTTVFMLRRWLCSPEVAFAKEVATDDPMDQEKTGRAPLSSEAALSAERVTIDNLINQIKEMEETSLQYLSQIREIQKTYFFILAALGERETSPLVSERDHQAIIEETKEHCEHITNNMIKCCRARKRIEESSPVQEALLQEKELADWKVILDDTIGENLQLFPNNQGDEIGSAIEECIKDILKKSKSTLEKLQPMQSADSGDRNKVVQRLSRLIGWCEQFCGTCEFMETHASTEEDKKTAERVMQRIKTWQTNLEKAYQRIELSYFPDAAKRYSSTKQKQVLSEGVKQFPATQQEHVDLLKRWRDHFSHLRERISSIDLSSRGKEYMVFQGNRMHERIEQYIQGADNALSVCQRTRSA